MTDLMPLNEKFLTPYLKIIRSVKRVLWGKQSHRFGVLGYGGV